MSECATCLSSYQPGYLPQLDLLAYLGLPFIHPGGFSATKKLFEVCRVHSGDILLDVGCGSGSAPCHAVKSWGCEAVGIDINPRMLARLKERRKRKRLDVHTVRGDATRLPFPEESFDIAVVESVLYLLEIQQGLSEIRRVLKSHGRVGAVEFAWLNHPCKELADEISRLRGVDFSTLTHEGWREMFMKAGFEEVESGIFGLERPSRFELLREEGIGRYLSIIWKLFTLPSDRRKRVRRAWRLETTSEELGYGIYCWKKK